MIHQVIKFNLCVTILYLLTSYQPALSQSTKSKNTAPYLKNGQTINTALRLGYRGEVNTYIVITMKFKISAAGDLDTLFISDNAPKTFVDAAKIQLNQLNGLWIPQKNNGKPVLSKWLVSHYYIGGFREDTSACAVNAQNDFFSAFKREESLFICDKKVDPPLKCLIDYVEGSQSYLLPPLLSNTVQ